MGILLKPQDDLEKAIKVLHAGGMRIALVVDDANKLLGTITDGDIRRALLRHVDMDELVTDVMNSNPSTASIDDSRDSILTMMKNRDLLHMPIVDANNSVVGLETLQHLIDKIKYENPVFLMAGGFGKRLSPLTNDTPKPLLNVGTKPILETILNQFIEYGFHDFYISTHYKANMVTDYFGDGSKWDVNINYIHEDEPLGTAGALGLLPDELPDLPIIMMNGDLLTKVNFEHLLRFHNEHNNIATMSVCKYDFQVPYGVVEHDGHIIKDIVEKPIQNFFINAGIYVLNRCLLNCIDGNSYIDMPHFLKEQINKGEKISTFPLHEYWLDIGRMEEYEQAHEIYGNEFKS